MSQVRGLNFSPMEVIASPLHTDVVITTHISQVRGLNFSPMKVIASPRTH